MISALRDRRLEAILLVGAFASSTIVGAALAYGDTKYVFAGLAALALSATALTAPRCLSLLAIPTLVLVPPTVRIPSLGAGLTPLRLIVAFAIAGWLVNGSRTTRMPTGYRACGLVFSAYVLLVASTHGFTSVTRGVGYSVESLSISWLAWRAIRDRHDLLNLIDLLIGVMIIASLLAVYETIVGHFLLPAVPSLFFHAPLREGHIRAQGVFPHPLVLGTALALMLPVAISRGLTVTGWRRAFSIGAALLYALTLILISGRGPWIGAGVAVLALAALTHGRQRHTIIASVLLCILVVAASPLQGKVVALASSITSNENGQEAVHSVRYRKTLLTASISYAAAHPFGTGPGREEMAHLTGSLEVGTHLTDSIDNAYAKYAVELGPIGLLLFIFLIASVLHCAWRGCTLPDPELALAAGGILAGEIAMLVTSATVATFTWQQLAALFWLLVGASAALRIVARPLSQTTPVHAKRHPALHGPYVTSSP